MKKQREYVYQIDGKDEYKPDYTKPRKKGGEKSKKTQGGKKK